MRSHLEMEARIMHAAGAGAGQARRQAALAFGGVEKYRGEARDVPGFTRVRGLWLDLRLGLRMVRRYPEPVGARPAAVRSFRWPRLIRSTNGCSAGSPATIASSC